MKHLFIGDNEASGLLDHHDLYYHCTLLKEYKVNNWVLFLDPEREGYQEAVNFAKSKGKNLRILPYTKLAEFVTTEPKAIAGHNFFSYDFPLWKKLSGIDFDMFKDPKCMGTLNGKPVALYDTLSISRLLYPDRPLPAGCPSKVKIPGKGIKTIGPHGLEAWGYRVANKKVEIEDWEGLPLWKYVDRVWEDVIINELVWTALMLEASGKADVGDENFFYTDKPEGLKQINWKIGLRRGMLADFLMYEQEAQGVVFNKQKGEELVVVIDKMMKEIADVVEPKLPLKDLPKSQQPNFPAKPFTDTGIISANGWNWLEEKLGYPVDREALDFVSPPKTAIKQDGLVSKAGETYCAKYGVTDPSQFKEFIEAQRAKEQTLAPLPLDLLEKAKQDLRDKKMPDTKIPMRLGNQDDIKKYLVSQGWQPTIWRTKDCTRDSKKKQRSDAEVDQLVKEYIEELKESEYRDMILKELGMSFSELMDSSKAFKKLRRKARGLPTSPQLRDAVSKILCPNLERLDGDMAKQIVKWLSLRNRRSVLDPIDEDKNDTGLLNHPRFDIDGKLPASWSGLTNTFRRKHKICANMPKPKKSVLLGKEMRSLWTVPEDCYMIGIDGSNLEGMIAAWGAFKFDGGEYLRIMESGDAHARNAKAYTEASGRDVSRDDGKPITYGVMYGAQPPKVANMLNVPLALGESVVNAFWDSNPGLKGRKEWLENFWEATGKRFIPAFDGRKIYTRSRHSLLNAYQQSGGAILMDLAGILLHWQIKNNGMYDDGVRRVIYYHKQYCGFAL